MKLSRRRVQALLTQPERRYDRLVGVEMSDRLAAEAVRDGDLIGRAADGDVNAFEALVAPRLARSFRTACAILGNEADAHDVVQDAFLAAWRHLPSLRNRAKFDPWLSKAIVNRCRDVLRRRRRAREVVLIDAMDHATEDSTAPIAGIQALNAAFERLSADQRHLLVLHHLHRVSVADLAAELGVPVGTAKWRLHAARASLERNLEADR